MRDSNRIDIIIEELREFWKEVPDWRLGQLIINISGMQDPFYLEDDKFLDKLHEWKEA